jgi:hypothetical protein
MMPIASHLHNVNQALASYRRALEEFESALLELEELPVLSSVMVEVRRERRWVVRRITLITGGNASEGKGFV